jgi:hypothetical protein
MSFLSGIFGGGSSNSQSEYGDDSGATKEITYSGILEDLRAAGAGVPKDLQLLLEAGSQGVSKAPIDDRKLVVSDF